MQGRGTLSVPRPELDRPVIHRSRLSNLLKTNCQRLDTKFVIVDLTYPVLQFPVVRLITRQIVLRCSAWENGNQTVGRFASMPGAMKSMPALLANLHGFCILSDVSINDAKAPLKIAETEPMVDFEAAMRG